ncbi:MAG: phasin family protein [Rhodospirillaceae bacterium]|jgi:phasin family protein
MTTAKKTKAAGANNAGKEEKTEKTESAQKAFKDLNEMMGEGTEAVEKAYQASAEIAAENYEKMMAMAQDNVEAAMNSGAAVFKDYDELTSFGKDNVDAFVKSGTIFAQGMQLFNKTMADLTRQTMEQGVQATQTFIGCKNFADVAKVNNDIVKKSYDQAITESRKLADMSIQLTEEVVTPLADRYNQAVDKFTKGMAA